LKRSKLTVATGKPESLFLEAKQTITSETSPGVSAPCMARICDATPATCGHAIDVPEADLVARSEFTHAAVILEPGAWMSTQDPWFENPLLASVLVVEPTVRASGADAGE